MSTNTAKTKNGPRVFDTDKRIRLGIWGLGRGMSFFNACNLLNIDVVAGCDFNEQLRTHFLNQCPTAFVTTDEDEFLRQDFDAVLLATFCPAHAQHAIKCLQAGKHVLSEVTAFFSMADGVKLVEEVEKRKLVYNLAENYPFSAANMWLANRWKEGLFGELMYAEYEYVHELRMLSYTYLNGTPVTPGHTVHNWRSWMSYHYYCTHSLGPVMFITGTRPTLVEALPCRPQLAGYLTGDGNGAMTPSFIQMNNGGLVRNLIGGSTSDSHQQRIWGTLGASEIGRSGLLLRLGASGVSPMLNVNPHWEGLGELAAQTGHGGGDFWVLYYFAREIFTGEKGPFDIYGGCDVTIPGIQALRSSREGGTPMEVPDFRKKADRDRYRNDNFQQCPYDVRRGVFAGAAIRGKAANFTATMKEIIVYAPLYRAYADWKKVSSALSFPADFLPIATKLYNAYDKLVAAYRDAREIVSAHPRSDGARVLAEMLAVGEEKTVLAPEFLPALKREVAMLKRKYGDKGQSALQNITGAALLKDKPAIADVGYPARTVKFTPLPHNDEGNFEDIRPCYQGKPREGLVYARGFFTAKHAGAGNLRIGADGPFKVFLNRKEIACRPRAANPIVAQLQTLKVSWQQGRNEVVIAISTNSGRAWGFMAVVLTE